MLAKRIIPCLDVSDGKTVKGINFSNLKFAGDPVKLASKYSADGADELVFLDITATSENRNTTVEMVEKVAKSVFIPFTVGGGIKNISEINTLLQAGADKISINSAGVKNPQLIEQAANYFGSQCIVAAIDSKFIENDYYVFINGGKVNSGIKLSNWIKKVEKLGAGEILLTSMDADGTQNGFDIKMLKSINQNLNIPIIASGGAGANPQHFKDVFQYADAALAASIFHYNTLPVKTLKKELEKYNIPIRRIYD